MATGNLKTALEAANREMVSVGPGDYHSGDIGSGDHEFSGRARVGFMKTKSLEFVKHFW